MGKSAAKRVG